ncbi:ATP-binding cassette domain-containing protein [Anaerotignum propionicum]|uniref:ATP-binding cassette domain-containing protein n=1 Tax=Anaerotignum propionicum TaxID=28446 RepID=UPI00210E069C|nr:ATP-binding cassette domain-containing protein [Anaerotignum propionicum]MCQ4936338.1 ATP-binding cassette domain-containing protein [Anaerotignum propionicum]
MNITAIVGDNGCGKSTLLRILLNTLPYGNIKCTDDDIVFAILENKTIKYYSTINELNKIKVNEEKEEKEQIVYCIYDKEGNFKGEEFKKSQLIYTNNFLDYSDYFQKNMVKSKICLLVD